MMTKFQVQPIKKKKVSTKQYNKIISPMAHPPLATLVVAPRRSGKSTLCCNLLVNAGYLKEFSEVLILSETIAQDSTYSELAKYDNVSVHDIRRRPIDNELLEEIWKRQEARFAQDPKKNDLLIVFDDLGTKMKSKELRAMMNKYFQLGRHPGISFIAIVQSILNCTSEQITCATEVIIFRLDQRQLRKVSETLATAEKDRDELESWIRRNTTDKYAWVYIQKEAEHDDQVYLAYNPRTNTFSSGD